MIPVSVQTYIQEWLMKNHAISGSVRMVPVGGGSINQSFRIEAAKQQFFCKLNSTKAFPGLFLREQQGLDLLAQAKVIRIPEVLQVGDAGDQQILLMEWIEQGLRTDAFWSVFGEQLAALHQVHGEQFGLNTNNYMGSLPQNNEPAGKWVEFFINRRLQPQIELALNKKLLDPSHVKAFDNLYAQLPQVFDEDVPCLVHGDLWSGNYLCDANSNPVLIDPAVYYGHRSIDLAMTTLFGGFDEIFYDSYHYHYPLPANYQEQWKISNLYPLLIHLNLFGKGYLADILQTIRHF